MNGRFTQKLCVLILIELCVLQVHAQTKLKAWLPERYVSAVNNNDTLAFRFLSPISGIMFDANGQLLISGYGGEPNKVMYKVISVGKTNKFHLFNVEKHINMKHESRELVDSLEKSSIFFSFNESYVKLEIYYEHRLAEIYFVDRYKGHIFTDIRDGMIYVGNEKRK
jgi:DNA-binding transcriptional regulator/RsmH inhibitor MraZ